LILQQKPFAAILISPKSYFTDFINMTYVRRLSLRLQELFCNHTDCTKLKQVLYGVLCNLAELLRGVMQERCFLKHFSRRSFLTMPIRITF